MFQPESIIAGSGYLIKSIISNLSIVICYFYGAYAVLLALMPYRAGQLYSNVNAMIKSPMSRFTTTH